MYKDFPNDKEDYFFDSGSDNSSFSNLDLLKFRLRSNPRPESTYQSIDKEGRGDFYQSSKPRNYHHPLTDRKVSLVLNNNKPGYDKPTPKRTEKILSIYMNNRNTQNNNYSEPINCDDFLYPSKRKTKQPPREVNCEENFIPGSRILAVDRGHGEGGTFPFKTTSSGNFKVDSKQVVYQSKKLSVIVADPNNTNVKIKADMMKEKERKDLCCHEDCNEIPANKLDAAKQHEFYSLERMLGKTPNRNRQESWEYECKSTTDILQPELNLGRLEHNGKEVINWEKVILPEKKNLYLELYSRITNYTNPDCKVYIDSEEFNCHLIVLQCYSELFESYIAAKKVELSSDQCSASSFTFIYEWMITGEHSYKELTRENVLDIFISAKYLKIKDLEEQCWAFIDHTEIFSEDKAFLLYMDAKVKGVPEVRELMLPRIQGFFLVLVGSQDWLELDVGDVKNLLKSNYICINCEMEIFMSAVRWLKHDWVHREKFKYEVLSCVRFGNIESWQLVDIKRNPENPDFTELAKDPNICKMIDDGLSYVTIKYWYGEEETELNRWNTTLGLQEPATRNFSGIEKSYLTYREFLIYLDEYRRKKLLLEKNMPKVEEHTKILMNGAGAAPQSPLSTEHLQFSPSQDPPLEDILSKKNPREGWPSKQKKVNKMTK